MGTWGYGMAKTEPCQKRVTWADNHQLGIWAKRKKGLSAAIEPAG